MALFKINVKVDNCKHIVESLAKCGYNQVSSIVMELKWEDADMISKFIEKKFTCSWV